MWRPVAEPDRTTMGYRGSGLREAPCPPARECMPSILDIASARVSPSVDGFPRGTDRRHEAALLQTRSKTTRRALMCFPELADMACKLLVCLMPNSPEGGGKPLLPGPP